MVQCFQLAFRDISDCSMIRNCLVGPTNIFCHTKCFVLAELKLKLKLLSKLIRILHITFCYTQLCGGCLVNMTSLVKVVIHRVFALL